MVVPSAEDLEELHRVAFETAPDAIVLLDHTGRVVRANAIARELPWRDAILPGWTTDPEWIAFRTELRARGRAAHEVRVDDRSLEIAGRTFGASCLLFIRDVTSARRAEDEWARMWGVASIGAFTASVVHDVGNLVTPLATLGEALARGPEDAAVRTAMVEEIRRVTQSAADLVAGVRGVLRGGPAKHEQLDVTSVVAEMRPLIERLVGGGVKVVFALDSSAGEAVVDRQRLERAMLNLVANARDAMPDGGRLTVHTYAAFADAASPYVVVSVADEGTGMSKTVQERAFDPLFTTKDSAGTGLGLWNVRRFAADTGGHVEVRSEVGDGTVVSIHLPCASRRTTSVPVPRQVG